MWAPALWCKGVDRGYGDRRADEGARRIRRQVGMSSDRNASIERNGAPAEALLALGSPLDEPPFRMACLALWTPDVAGRGARTASLELRP